MSAVFYISGKLARAIAVASLGVAEVRVCHRELGQTSLFVCLHFVL